MGQHNGGHVVRTVTLLVLLGTVNTQSTPCDYVFGGGGGSSITINVQVTEASAADLLKNPSSSLYKADTGIQGFLNGNAQTGIQLTLSNSLGTPAGVTVTDLFRLVEEPITPSNGFNTRTFIQLKSPVDRDGVSPTHVDDLEVIEFEIQCARVGQTGSAEIYLIRVEIDDVNNNAPVFIGAPYVASVGEAASIGTTVFASIAATDLDSGANKEVNFAIVPRGSNDGSDKFELPVTRKGEVVVKNILDFESVTSYVLNISATDQARVVSTRRTTYTTLTITIEDADDLGPRFVYANCFTVAGSPVANACFNPTYRTSVVSGISSGVLSMTPVTVTVSNPPTTDIISRDSDTLNAGIQYSIVQTVPAGYENSFSVSTSNPSGNLYQATITQIGALNRNTIQNFDIILRAVEQTVNRYEERATIQVTVATSNNNNPVVTNSPVTGYINENSPVGTIPTDSSGSTNIKLQVTDIDLVQGETQSYAYSVQGTGIFTVNSDGYIVLTTPNLNYEATQSVVFSVQVTEAGTNSPRSTTAQVTIIVRDLNDNTPTFTANSYTDSIPKGDYSIQNQVLLDVVATDADTGVNGDIVYTIKSVSKNGAGKFAIASAASGSGATLSVTGSVAENEKYIITVEATDQAANVAQRRASTVTVEVTVTPLETKAPVIPSDNYAISVSEGVPVGTSVFSVPATDPEGQTLSFSFFGTGNQAGDFIIDQTTGEVRTTRVLDRETTPSYSIDIRVQDTTGNSDQTKLNLQILDINDNTPRFQQNSYTFNVNEGSAGLSVGTVTATDNDLGANGQVVYQIATISPAFAKFSINGGSGDLTTAQALDFETEPQLVFLVLAVDGGASSRTGTATVTVNVNDLQDSVPLFTETNIVKAVPENIATGTSVAQVIAVDADVVDQITYKFLSGDFTDFNLAANGLITNRVVLDYETKNQYIFTVTTQEGENSNQVSSTVQVTIIVQDLNDFTPQISGIPSFLEFLENIPVGTILLSSITVTDGDPQGSPNSKIVFSKTTVTASPSSAFNHADLFYVNPTNGGITLTRPFTNDRTPDQYEVTINAQDSGVPSLAAAATIRINVIRNNPPVFSPPSVTVDIDSTKAISALTTFAAIDNDRNEFNMGTYSFIPDSRLPTGFTVNANSGQINLVTSLLNDNSKQYLLTVIAEDKGGLTATGTVTINVDRNLNTPQWVPNTGPFEQTISVLENRPVLDTIYTLQAVDNDQQTPYNQLQFTLTGDSRALQYVTIDDSGNLKLARSLSIDRSFSQFKAIVTLSDKGDPVRTQAQQYTVTVNVIRNNAPPLFFTQSYYAEINENVITGTRVLNVNATDADPSFQSITYSLIANSAGNNLFQINSGNGDITTKALLSTDPTVLHTMVAVATDNGNPARSATAFVTIKVIKNFFAPTWITSNYQTSVLEIQDLGVALSLSPSSLTAGVTDNDNIAPNNQINFRVIGTSLGTEFFQVSPSGDVSVKKSLTTGTASSYQIQVQAYDLGDPSKNSVSTATVTINVQRNRPPVFTSQTYQTTIQETHGAGTSVYSVAANDPDVVISQFNSLTYSIDGLGLAPSYFTINSLNGMINLTNIPLTSITDTVFQLLVKVQDNGVPNLVDEAIVTINIARNLFTPEFNPLQYQTTIQETLQAGNNVGVTVAATDRDLSPPNNQVRFSAVGDAQALTYFDIDSISGAVRLRQPVNTGSLNEYLLRVQVTDLGNPALKSQQTATVTITIERNSFPPVFTNLPNTISLPRSASAGTFVYDVNATDADIKSPFNDIRYSIVSGSNFTSFTINSIAGVITLNTNTLSLAEYRLSIRAEDRGNQVEKLTLTFTFW